MANIATLVLVFTAVLVVTQRYATQPGETESRLSDLYLEGVDLSQSALTLVVVVQRGCPYCDQSMLFYRSLIEQRALSGANLRIVVVAPRDSIGNQRVSSIP